MRPSSRKVLFEDKDFGYLEYEVEFGLPWLHSEIYYWTPSAYKEYKKILKESMKILKGNGFRAVYVLIPDDDPKLYKFEVMFGFTAIRRDPGIIIMKQEL